MIKYYRVTYESVGATQDWITRAKNEKHALMKFQNACMRALGFIYKVSDITEVVE